MHKRRVCIISLICGAWAALMFAQANNGRIIDIFGKNVTVRMDSPITLNAGDRVDLTYAADTMEFQIGRYEVVQIKENVFIAKELSSAMPPSQEMKVRVIKSAVDAGIPQQKPATPRAATPDPPEKGNRTVLGLYGKLPPLPDENDPHLNGQGSRQSVAPVPESRPAPTASAKKSAKVAVLGPDEGVDPSAPPAGQSGAGKDIAPRTGSPAGQRDAFLGVPIPRGQQDMARPVDKSKLPGEWRELTLEEYQRKLNEEYKAGKKNPDFDPASRIVRPQMGVSIKDNDSPIGQTPAGTAMGVRVVDVVSGSLAAKNGIEVGDIIAEIDGIKVTSSGMFIKYVTAAKDRIRLKIQRDGKLLEKSIHLSND